MDPVAVEVLVLHGTEKYSVSFPSCYEKNSESATVQELAEKLEKISGVPVTSQRLISKGRSLTNLTASLQSYGINSGSKIMLLGSRPNALYQSEEFQSICRVESLVANLENKLGNISTDVNELKKGFLAQDLACEMLTKLNQQLKHVSEEFMKLLEQLDAMTFGENQKEARMRRKGVVDQIQKLLRRTDEIAEVIESYCTDQKNLNRVNGRKNWFSDHLRTQSIQNKYLMYNNCIDCPAFFNYNNHGSKTPVISEGLNNDLNVGIFDF
uniref:BAG family molecular chaperone regulator 1 n=1 Tax=Strigamia maritima TaxID=126957 RepID=T1J8N3_STRMM